MVMYLCNSQTFLKIVLNNSENLVVFCNNLQDFQRICKTELLTSAKNILHNFFQSINPLLCLLNSRASEITGLEDAA